MPESINEKAREILKNSEQIYSPEQVQKTIVELASELNRDFGSPDQTPPHVIVLDDILDEGQTLLHVREKLLDLGAARVVLVAFAEKNTGATKPVKADYIGLTVPGQFVIGFGMDIEGFWRNLPDIRVLKKI